MFIEALFTTLVEVGLTALFLACVVLSGAALIFGPHHEGWPLTHLHHDGHRHGSTHRRRPSH